MKCRVNIKTGHKVGIYMLETGIKCVMLALFSLKEIFDSVVTRDELSYYFFCIVCTIVVQIKYFYFIFWII